MPHQLETVWLNIFSVFLQTRFSKNHLFSSLLAATRARERTTTLTHGKNAISKMAIGKKAEVRRNTISEAKEHISKQTLDSRNVGKGIIV
jgi:hypothetical protein